VKSHEIKHAKHELAQLLTVEHERKLAAASVAATQA
jgi:ribosomal protein L29